MRNGRPERFFIVQCPSTFCCMGTDKTSMRAYCIPACLWNLPEFLTVLHQYKPFFKGRVKRKMNCQCNPVQSIKANKKKQKLSFTINISVTHLPLLYKARTFEGSSLHINQQTPNRMNRVDLFGTQASRLVHGNH